jgi:hypothetical protein
MKEKPTLEAGNVAGDSFDDWIPCALQRDLICTARDLINNLVALRDTPSRDAAFADRLHRANALRSYLFTLGVPRYVQVADELGRPEWSDAETLKIEPGSRLRTRKERESWQAMISLRISEVEKLMADAAIEVDRLQNDPAYLLAALLGAIELSASGALELEYVESAQQQERLRLAIQEALHACKGISGPLADRYADAAKLETGIRISLRRLLRFFDASSGENAEFTGGPIERAAIRQVMNDLGINADILRAVSDTPVTPPAMPIELEPMTVSELSDALKCSNATLGRIARDAGVKGAERGQKNFRFDGENVRRIARAATASTTKTIRDAAASLLQDHSQINK